LNDDEQDHGPQHGGAIHARGDEHGRQRAEDRADERHEIEQAREQTEREG
jgi:hypothetical protein